MALFSKKTTFLIGSLVGSIAGMLFAGESGRNLRARLGTARTSQHKFEILFQEYLKAGKEVFQEVEESGLLREVAKGGREILNELKKKSKHEGGRAVALAQKKTAELIAEAEKRAKGLPTKARKAIRKTTTKAGKTVLKTARKTSKTVTKNISRLKKSPRKIKKVIRKK